MLELVAKRWKKDVSKNQLIETILNFNEHEWIRDHSYIKLNVQEFLERLPKKVLEKVFFQQSTIFVRSNGKFACSVTSMHQNAVIVFPELYTLLTKINDGWAKAVLAHEIGHIYLDHAHSNDIMETQVDADEFACELGYLDEIEEFLHEQPDSIEKRVRLTFITNYYFAKNNPV